MPGGGGIYQGGGVNNGLGFIINTPFGITWSGDTTHAPSADVLYNALVGFIPYVSKNYISVDAIGTATSNGTKLLAALTTAYMLTPNSVPLSATNRAVLLLFPGVYDLGASFLAISSFVDIYCFGGSDDIIVTSSNATGTIQIANTNNYIFNNFTVINTGAGGSIVHNVGQTDTGYWNNLVLKSKTEAGTIYAGIYTNLIATINDVLSGDITGEVKYSSFKNNSCGGINAGNITVSGSIINCSGLQNCFGGTNSGNVIVSGYIANCTNNDNAYGFSNSGTVDITSTAIIINCKGKDFCFGATIDSTCTIAGNILNCFASGTSFAFSSTGSVSLSGIINNCIGGATLFCFASSNNSANITITSTGKIQSCISTGIFSFGSSNSGNIVITGLIDNCKGTNACFGQSALGTVTIDGTISNCIGDTNCFGGTIAGGLIINCTGVLLSGIPAGTIDKCTFIGVQAAPGSVVTISTGAIIRYCTIRNNGSGETIDGVLGTTASIYQCSLSKAENVINVTNNIVTPFNVVDVLI